MGLSIERRVIIRSGSHLTENPAKLKSDRLCGWRQGWGQLGYHKVAFTKDMDNVDIRRWAFSLFFSHPSASNFWLELRNESTWNTSLCAKRTGKKLFLSLRKQSQRSLMERKLHFQVVFIGMIALKKQYCNSLQEADDKQGRGLQVWLLLWYWRETHVPVSPWRFGQTRHFSASLNAFCILQLLIWKKKVSYMSTLIR